jgi:hypothetical protein
MSCWGLLPRFKRFKRLTLHLRLDEASRRLTSSAAPNSCPSNYTFRSRMTSIISLGALVISCAWPQLVASLPKTFGLRPLRPLLAQALG